MNLTALKQKITNLLQSKGIKRSLKDEIIYKSEAEIPEEQKSHYEQSGDGFGLKQTSLDTMLSDQKAKVNEFRNTNINLLKNNEDLSTKLKGFDGLDMDSINKANQATNAKTTELGQLQKNFEILNGKFDKQDQELTLSKKQNQISTIEKSVFSALDKLGTLRKGSNHFIMQDSLKNFTVKDGVVKHINPLDALEQSPESWVKSKHEAGDFNIFKEDSAGSGAPGGKTQTSNVMTADNIVELAKGKNLQS